MKITIYIDEKDAQNLYDNIKFRQENVIEYDHQQNVSLELCFTIDYGDYINLKDRNLLIEF